jgi:bacterioferritin B
MLMSRAMNDQINEQIGHEFGASFQYINIAGYFDGVGLQVLSRHFLRQAEEEREHAMKFVRYVLDAGGAVAVPAIPEARASFASAEEAVGLALEWELTVTKQITALLDLASRERDYVAHDFLEWFAREQLEEVSSMDALLKMVQRAGEPNLLQVENAIEAGRLGSHEEEKHGGHH